MEALSQKSACSGLTLVEVIVALVVLGVGVLALARASSGVARLMIASVLSTDVDALAGSQMEWLHSQACFGDSRSGTHRVGRVAASWSVTATGTHRDLVVVIESPRRTSIHLDTLRSYVVCGDPS